jgi:hypothetical protein
MGTGLPAVVGLRVPRLQYGSQFRHPQGNRTLHLHRDSPAHRCSPKPTVSCVHLKRRGLSLRPPGFPSAPHWLVQQPAGVATLRSLGLGDCLNTLPMHGYAAQCYRDRAHPISRRYSMLIPPWPLRSEPPRSTRSAHIPTPLIQILPPQDDAKHLRVCWLT